MKFSESWLREWVNPDIDTEALVEQLTMAGLEVDGTEPAADEFSGVIVGQIQKAEQHPDADKLRVCEVLGADNAVFQVVCGAANAREGIKVPFATVGAKLPGDFKIKKAKLRGVESHGMLCAKTELKAGEDDAGLWELPEDAPVGTDLREYLNFDDQIIEVDLTPNRSDCLGLKGIAREVGVLNRMDVIEQDFPAVSAECDETFDVELNAGEACPRYIGRVIQNVNATLSSPMWMQEKLRRSDIRPIDAIVDITNYVLLELGQPMHAFDYDKLSGSINVRMAEEGEKLQLLNDQEVSLAADTLVISDASKALAMAGVMGGAYSAVSAETKNIFLEAAFFAPTIIAGKARSYGLHTDSSHRFERGVDPDLAKVAIERATQLVLDICGGSAGPTIITESTEHLPAPKEVELRKARIESGLGFAIPDEDVEDILQRLGLVLLSKDEASWRFGVPSTRFDLSIEVDLLEELARIYGYNNLPTTTNFIPQVLNEHSEDTLPQTDVLSTLVARNYREVITYSFIDPELHKRFFGDTAVVELLNPISVDLSVMRTSLIPGLVHTLTNNVNRQHDRVRIFEKGQRFQPTESGLKQKLGVAGLIYGSREDAGWLSGKAEVDFYDMKGDVEAILQLSSSDYGFLPCDDQSYMHPGQSAYITLDGEKVGLVGALHPELLKAQGLSKTAYVFELDFDSILKTSITAYTGISRYPEVERDLAFLVNADIPVADILSEIRSVAGENLKQLKVFDIYSGEGIDSERKSAAFHLTFQHSSRTLNEDEVNAAVEAVIRQLKGTFDAALR